MVLLLVLAQALVDDASAPAPCAAPHFVTASTTGAFLVVADKAALHVLDGKTLQLVRKIDVKATAVGFDAQDAAMTVVGEAWTRLDTKEWKETFRAKLADAEFRRVRREEGSPFEPAQALAMPDGALYYVSKDEHLSRASVVDGTPKSEVLTARRLDETMIVEGLLGTAGRDLLVRTERRAGIVTERGGPYPLMRSEAPLAAGPLGARVVVVRKDGESFYDTRTWKIRWNRDAENVAAALDLRRGRAYAAGKTEVRHWNEAKPEEVASFPGRFHALAVDAAATRLYALDAKTVRSWILKD